MDPTLPQIGRYPTLGVLGAGGMGTVYLGRHPELGFELAIKVLLSGRGASEAQRRRFQREVRALRQLRHLARCALCTANDVGGVSVPPTVRSELESSTMRMVLVMLQKKVVSDVGAHGAASVDVIARRRDARDRHPVG